MPSQPIGILWYMDANKSLEVNILDAKKYYEDKYFGDCDLCLVNEKDIPASGLPTIKGVKLETKPYILRQHLWVGNSTSPNMPVERPNHV